MSRFGFCGATYQSQSLNADCQRAINWYPEANESGQGKSPLILLPTPGLSMFSQNNGAQVRGEFTVNGRMFCVIDTELNEVLISGALNALGTVVNDLGMASFASSPQELVVASGGNLYVFFLQTVGGNTAGTFLHINPATFPAGVTQVAYIDGFFVALIASTEQFFVSALFDATTWPGASAKIISVYPDNVVSLVNNLRLLWLLGGKASEVEYDSGNIFPFDTLTSGFMEEGCGAQFATVQLDNSIMWIGARNDQGTGVAWRASGFTPQRISNHSVETAWQSYSTISDARAFSYQDQGHKFWQINFPSAPNGATWVYDVATNLWHERAFWNRNLGIYQTALPQCHTFCFGKHLVGDRQSGNIYQMAIPSAAVGGGWNFVTDNNNTIRRLRRAPHISTEQQWIYHHKLQVDVESGVGPEPPLLDGLGNARDPQLFLRYSDDGVHTWSNYNSVGFGQAGNYRTRAIWRRLGRSRDRVYEITCSDPVPVRIIDAYLDASPGFQPQERLTKQAAKVA